ncbi:MAG: GGDEF domain-containing protein [Acidobacteriaceae bacterium]|nr:GGDEF domain-containing protein [Acidobacteriaceae bacterium]
MDINTLFFVESSLFFLFGLTMLVNYLANPGLRGAYWFVVSNLAGGIALSLQGARAHLPVIIGIVLSNLLFVVQLVCLNRAVTAFLGRMERMWIAVLSVCIVGMCGIAYFSLVHPDIGVRVAVISAMMATPSLMTAWVLFGPAASGVRTASRLLGSVFVFFAAVTSVRGYAVYRFHLPSFYFIWLDLIVIAGIAFGFIWMSAAQLREDLERQAMTDPLTGVLNRRAVEREVVELLRRSAKTGGTISALMLDMDHFKGINDRFGHHGGDRALLAVTNAIQRSVRGTDLVARLGGDEFMVVLPDTPMEMARMIAELIRGEVSALRVQTETHQFQVRVSVGITTLVGQIVGLEDLIKQSDRALYEAKAAGRNRVFPSGELEPAFMA